MKLRTIVELQYKIGPHAGTVASSLGHYQRSAINDLTDDQKSEKKQKTKPVPKEPKA